MNYCVSFQSFAAGLSAPFRHGCVRMLTYACVSLLRILTYVDVSLFLISNAYGRDIILTYPAFWGEASGFFSGVMGTDSSLEHIMLGTFSFFSFSLSLSRSLCPPPLPRALIPYLCRPPPKESVYKAGW
jgi:hypothetical protein